jgi:FKBP-type peptidyl-prolyl cis-trans isomerase 2
MTKAQKGDMVKVHYTGKTEDDRIFETTQGGPPLKFEIGSKSVIPQLEKGVLGMQVGDKKTFTVPPEEGFGQRKQELIGTVKKSSFPDHIAPTVGQQVQLQLPNGKNLNVSVADIEDEIVTLDGNHPLAGHTLKFDVEMIDII